MLDGASLTSNIRTKKHHNEVQETVIMLGKNGGKRPTKKFLPNLETQRWLELKLLKVHFNGC